MAQLAADSRSNGGARRRDNFMRYRPTLLYAHPLADLDRLIEGAVTRGCRRHRQLQPIELFFRADDIGVPSLLFSRMIELFQHYHMPLCLAIVPSWLTEKRYAGLRAITGNDDTFWCWHQHGRRHRNFEPEGKKQEFGPARSKMTIQTELQHGLDRLHHFLQESFSPFFTPPWNRCSLETAEVLKALGFKGISRSTGARPDLSRFLPDFQINVDLHTRKEPTAAESLENLLREVEDGLASGRCGIMIHHQRMNDHAFLLLDLLMGHFARRPEIAAVTFEDLQS